MSKIEQDRSDAPWNTVVTFSNQKRARKEKATIIAVISISTVFFVALCVVLFRFLLPSDSTVSFTQTGNKPDGPTPKTSDTAEEPVDETEIILVPPVSPEPVSAEPAEPREGISSAETSVRDVICTSSGQVYSLEELIDGEWVYWVYEYDRDDMFLYRYRNIGTVESKLGPNVIPGTDTTYSDTFVDVNNCVGFTLEYAVTEVYAGDGLGERTLCLHSYGSWLEEEVFDYPRYETFYYSFRFDRPVSFNGFGTPRVHPDSSMFMTHQVLTDVLIADYDYVYLP